MKLVISEKPSVAQSIAAVIGAKQRGDGYLEGGGYLVSWCLGHLAELAEADTYDKKYAKWRREDLPILPESWRFTVGKDKRKQFDILRTLMRRDDVSEVINACDAGREGELIFRTVYCMAGCSKPMKRLWISSMEDESIRQGFADLKPGRDYDGLHQSALCRSKADWLVGINATRLFSVLYHRTLNVGRVMSPTLALIVQREAEISAFQPQPFYTVSLDCGDFTATGDKLKAKPETEAVAAACKGKTATVKTVERKENSEKPPALYDLTTLQRDANRLLGYTAQQTLDYLQSLYEKKLCTYPRTDSRFLTNDMEGTVPVLASVAAAICGADVPANLNASQVCDSAKVSDHHAVVPTLSACKADVSALPAGEREILRLVSRQRLCAVSEPHRYAETAVTL
ncbi:MAG: DNA topoisomerase, partial [Intestinibacillus sp.]